MATSVGITRITVGIRELQQEERRQNLERERELNLREDGLRKGLGEDSLYFDFPQTKLGRKFLLLLMLRSG